MSSGTTLSPQVMGARLKSARVLRGKTLDDVATSVGMNKTTIMRYERGQIQSPKAPILRAIAGYLNINPGWLTGESDQIEPDSQSSLERYLEMVETRPEIRALLKSVDGADPAEVEAVIDFFTALRRNQVD
ncbi:MAG: helix-turn-helix domain-containing protein [Oscillospiraceae bacterium]|nr:helix-turn-helix domain-containing protein [Oscillospiraceae bacterium]